MKFLIRLAVFGFLGPCFAQAQTAPTIVSQTSSQTRVQGEPLSLTVSVNGTSPFTYQWTKDSVVIASATSNIYSIAALALADAGTYQVKVTNAAGSKTGASILIDVTAATPPSFYSMPSNVNVVVGNRLEIYASAGGSSPLTFEWRKGDTVVATGTDASYAKSNAQVTDSGTYTLTVKNIAGTVTSGAVIVTVSPPAAPVFYYSPTSQQLALGASLSLQVGVADSSGVTFQWYKDGVVIPGATSSSYYKGGITAADLGSYTVKATNSAGTTTSSAAVITQAPEFPPSYVQVSSGSTTITAGQSWNLSAYVSGGSAPFSFEWLKDGGVIEGATTAMLTKSNASAADAGTYAVRVFNSAGSLTSAAVQVSVKKTAGQIISRQPASTTVYPGDSASFAVSLSQSGTASFQWRKDGVAIAGANSSGYSIHSVAASDEGVYSVDVTTAFGTLTSDAATLKVLPPYAPVILAPPMPRTINPGEWLELSVQASGRPQLTYQWYKDGEPIAGATSSSYGRSTVAKSDAGSYTVTVVNSEGSVSTDPVSVTVVEPPPPVFYQHPQSASVLPGGYFSLSAIADWNYYSSGTAYQWYLNDVPIPGATSSSYTISGAQPAHAGTYKVVASNAAGSATSREAIVTVDLSSARPLITSTSGSLMVTGGEYTSFGITLAPGHTGAVIAWKKDGIVVPNATGATLNLSPFNATMEGTYVADVTSGSVTAVSQPIVITLRDRDRLPEIRRQPVSQARVLGEYVAFVVQAEGEKPLTYQWRKGGQIIPGATYSEYPISPILAAHAGDYSVTVTNRNGSVESETVSLTILDAQTIPPPVISTHPAGITLTPESNWFDLSVQLHGYPSGITYQWFKDGTALTGETYGSLSRSIHGDPTSLAGSYKVVVTNVGGSVTSDVATVRVATESFRPSFSVQPQTLVTYEGGSATFTATAVNGSVTYQWRKDGTDIDGAVGASLTVEDIDLDDEGSYSVVAFNDAGATPSSIALLTVSDPIPPLFTEQPTKQVAVYGGSATFTAVASGLPQPTYQWRRDSQPIAGATSATLNLTNLKVSDAGVYTVVATNSAGSATSSGAKLHLYETMPVAPSITIHPADASADLGEKAAFTVGVGGTPPFTYQWYRNGLVLPGATQSSLNVSPITTQTSGSYHVVVMNDVGQAQSNAATLSLDTPYVDVYQSGFLGGWSLIVYPDRTATFIGSVNFLSGVVIAERFPIAEDGSFVIGAKSPSSSSMRKPLAVTTADSGFYQGQIIGSVAEGLATITIETNLTPTVASKTATGAPEHLVIYKARTLGDGGAELYMVVTPFGRTAVVVTDDAAYTPGGGSYSGDGSFQISSNSFHATGYISPNAEVSGSITIESGPALTLAAMPSSGAGTERLAAVSTRSVAGVGSETLISGFAISGTQKKKVLIRAVGPALEPMGVTNYLANPRLAVFQGQNMILENDDWSSDSEAGAAAAEAAARLGDFPLPEGSKDAALVAELEPGVYTTHVSSAEGASGIALLEVYDASPSGLGASKVLALSTRGAVRAGDGVLIVGFVVEGPGAKRVLVRGVGPGMGGGLPDALQDPQLRVYSGSTALAENDDWSTRADAADLAEAAAANGAGALELGSKDAAVLLYLAPGIYTAHVSGANNSTGVALVEVYEVP